MPAHTHAHSHTHTHTHTNIASNIEENVLVMHLTLNNQVQRWLVGDGEPDNQSSIPSLEPTWCQLPQIAL